MKLIDVIALSKYKCAKPIKAELKYATSDNLVGRPLHGYQPHTTDFALMTPLAAEQLCKTQNFLTQYYNFGLIIYDAYRPKQAVEDLLVWSQHPMIDSVAENHMKQKFYPHIEKSELFPLGYVHEDSGHCYGNTVDVFLLELATGEVLDMGAGFDFMDPLSHLNASNQLIGAQAHRNRRILVEAMSKFGFLSYEYEFWHFSHGGKAGREVLTPMYITITPGLQGYGVKFGKRYIIENSVPLPPKVVSRHYVHQ